MGKRGPKRGALYRKTKRRMSYIRRLLQNEEQADLAWAQELLTIALFDHREFFDKAGNLKPVTEWTPEMGAVAASSETILKNAEAGDKHIDKIHKLKQWDKMRALELWGKYRGKFVEKGELTLKVSLEDLVAGSRE